MESNSYFDKQSERQRGKNRGTYRQNKNRQTYGQIFNTRTNKGGQANSYQDIQPKTNKQPEKTGRWIDKVKHPLQYTDTQLD